jgi:GntR family transcriptional regulator, transcriptional repressor for pyruvate dehydrogenase complex
MHQALSPVVRQSLSDGLAERVRQLIQRGGFQPGDRLPSIADMARRFGVGHPTLREALKKLETLGIVNIRHGSGVYVGRDDNSLVISNPVFTGSITRRLLVDLVEARIPVELTTVELAAKNATAEDVEQMRQLLVRASESLDDDALLSSANMAFHRAIASASGNSVLSQLLEVLTNVFHDEQRVILNIYGSRRRDHQEHLQILQAIEAGDSELAVSRMRAHLNGVREVLLRWEPDTVPAA